MPDLTDQIRNKLDTGLLPRVVPNLMWGGHGHDNRCGCCDEPIRPAQIEYEFEMIPQYSGDVFRFHIGCLEMWLAELRRRGLVTPS
jgi:hypothetical protein